MDEINELERLVGEGGTGGTGGVGIKRLNPDHANVPFTMPELGPVGLLLLPLGALKVLPVPGLPMRSKMFEKEVINCEELFLTVPLETGELNAMASGVV